MKILKEYTIFDKKIMYVEYTAEEERHIKKIRSAARKKHKKIKTECIHKYS